MDAKASAAASAPAWTPAFLRIAAELRLLDLGELVVQLTALAHVWYSRQTTAPHAAAQNVAIPQLMDLGNKVPRPAVLPLTGNAPIHWTALPSLIAGATVSERCDSLTQLLWQASTHPHPLYNSQTQLRLSRSLHVYRHDTRARQMAWVHPVPTALNAAQWSTQDNSAHGRKALLIQNSRVLLQGTDEWQDAAHLPCPLCQTDCTAADITAHLMLDCASLSEKRLLAVRAIHGIISSAAPPAAPDASARVAVPIPKALAGIVASVSANNMQLPAEDRVVLHRLLICAQWPAGATGSLTLLAHEAAALTWCGSPSVWAPRHALLDDLPSKRKRKHNTLDSVTMHPAWMAVCARCAAWCAAVFDAVTTAKLALLADGTEEHGDILQIVKCAEG